MNTEIRILSIFNSKGQSAKEPVAMIKSHKLNAKSKKDASPFICLPDFDTLGFGEVADGDTLLNSLLQE